MCKINSSFLEVFFLKHPKGNENVLHNIKTSEVLNQKPLVSYVLLHYVPHRLIVAEPKLARVELQVDNKMSVQLPRPDKPTLSSM